MKKFMFALLFSFVAATAQAQNFESLAEPESVTPVPAPVPAPAASSIQSGCGDDPRFYESLVEILASKAPVSPPMTVTPETYLNLDKEVVERLAGQMTICPNIPVLKSGQFMKKVAIDFEPLWDKIRQAAMDNDMDTIKILSQSFIAKPKDPQEITLLFGGAPLEHDSMIKMYKTLGIRESSSYDSTNCKNYFSLADIFLAFGGRSTVKTEVHFIYGGIRNDQQEKLPKGSIILFLPQISGYCTGALIGDKLNALGLIPVAIQ
jgi:hypothetical protein